MNGAIWSPEHEALARKMAAEGKSGAEIGRAVGRSREAAIGWCWRHDVKLLKPPGGRWK